MSVFELWLPVALSGLATHILSTLAWMAFPHHKPEWKRLPVEDEFQDWLNDQKVAPDQYLFPCSHDAYEKKSESVHRKSGNCQGTLILWKNPTNMGTAIGLTLAFFFVAAFVIGYLASLALPAGAPFLRVLQFVTTAGLLTHCAGKFPGVFWFRRRVAMDLVDGVVYAIATGLIFAALWPSV